MNSMLMGGIVPAQISKEFVLAFMDQPFKRVKKLAYGDYIFEGNSWKEVILSIPGLGESDVQKVARVITRFLRISAQYGLIGGPNALLRLRTARIDLIELGRPLVDIAIRIMKDMRRSDTNRMESLRIQFIRERSVPKALRLMQFAPGFSYYNNELAPLPTSLQARLVKYQNPAKAGAAIRRALKRRKGIPQLSALERFDTRAFDYAPTRVTRVRGDMLLPSEEPTEKQLARRQRAQETMAAHDEEYYRSLAPELRSFI